RLGENNAIADQTIDFGAQERSVAIQVSRMAMTSERGYWAFICYSHADEAAARWLHRSLESYRFPKTLQGQQEDGSCIPSKLFPIFRDREELAASSSLSARIQDALSQSRSLIVIASPRAVSSDWVNEEIRCFKADGRNRPVLSLIVDGEPYASAQGAEGQECFPPALRFELDPDGAISDRPAEPIAADLRPDKDGRRDALLKVVAGVVGLGLDALKQREAQRRHQRMRWIVAASLLAMALTTTLSVLALQARIEAERQRQLAQARQQQAEGLIDFMLGDLRSRLEPIGQLGLLDAVGEQAIRYFGELPASALSEIELAARAQALRQIGDVRVQQGRLSEASPAFQEALRLDEELARRQPGNLSSVFNVAQSEFYIAYDQFERAEYEVAEHWFLRYLRSAEFLVSSDGGNPAWRQELAYANYNLAALFDRTQRYPEMLQRSTQALELWRELQLEPGGDSGVRQGLIEALSWQSRALYQNGQFEASLLVIDEAIRLQQADSEVSALNRLQQAHLATYYNQKLLNALAADQPKVAAMAADQAAQLFASLLDADPSNLRWQKFALGGRIQRAQLRLMKEEIALGAQELRRALVDCQALAVASPDDGEIPRTCLRGQLTAWGLSLAGIAVTELPGGRVDVPREATPAQSWLAALLAAESEPSSERMEFAQAVLAQEQLPEGVARLRHSVYLQWMRLLSASGRACSRVEERRKAALGDADFVLFLHRHCIEPGR
ncbi:MAG: TIR domain-containing protein, partial [Oceanococcaceae bacterium]